MIFFSSNFAFFCYYVFTPKRMNALRIFFLWCWFSESRNRTDNKVKQTASGVNWRNFLNLLKTTTYTRAQGRWVNFIRNNYAYKKIKSYMNTNIKDKSTLFTKVLCFWKYNIPDVFSTVQRSHMLIRICPTSDAALLPSHFLTLSQFVQWMLFIRSPI